MKKYALIGEKLSHSYSPMIHREIFNDMKVEASYELLEVKKEDLGKAIDKLRSLEYHGFNVTIPYKVEVMQYLDEVSLEAKEIGSVNTIANIDGKIIGFNTDYYGFYQELLYYKVEVKNKNCYVLGTGGASLAVSKALKDLGGIVQFVSRTPKGKNCISYENLKKEDIDVIVNTTPVGMYPHTEGSPLEYEVIQKAKVVMDIIFNPKKTKLLELAHSNMNGLYMLVGQALKAEEIWQNKKYNSSIEELLKRIELII